MMNKWTIPNVPNTGRKTFCLINCLHMLFEFQGENIPLHRLIPMTGLAFGFRYFNDGRFVHPVVMGCTCASALSFASDQLGYGFDLITDKDWDTAWGQIKQSLSNNLPVAVGPIPYAILGYNPKAGEELRGDHFCVLCGFDEEEDLVWVNDPDGFSYAPLALSAIQKVWQHPRPPCPIMPQVPLALMLKSKSRHAQGESLKGTLERACRVMKGEILYEPLEGADPPHFTFIGIPGEKKLAADVRSRFEGADDKNLAQISRRMQEVTFLQGTQAKSDTAFFLRNWTNRPPGEENKKELSRIAEYYDNESALHLEAVKTCYLVTRAVAENNDFDDLWDRLSEILEEIVSLEERALDAIEQVKETL